MNLLKFLSATISSAVLSKSRIGGLMFYRIAVTSLFKEQLSPLRWFYSPRIKSCRIPQVCTFIFLSLFVSRRFPMSLISEIFSISASILLLWLWQFAFISELFAVPFEFFKSWFSSPFIESRSSFLRSFFRVAFSRISLKVSFDLAIQIMILLYSTERKFYNFV